MASIIKRKKNYSIVYTYVDENGETKQKWETRTSYQEALKRKAEIESQKSSTPSFHPPIRILRSSCPTSFPSTAKSGGACPCMTAKTR